MSVRDSAVESAIPSGYLHATGARSKSTALGIQRFNDFSAAKQFVFIRVYSWLTFADGCG